MKSLEGEGYRIDFDPDQQRITLEGSLRLSGLSEYAPVSEMLEAGLEQSFLEIDLSGLEFLNSSGIATLSTFVIAARNRGDTAMRIRGSNDIPWQGKSLNNLKRLMPALELTFD